jgi:hypothetical protein
MRLAAFEVRTAIYMGSLCQLPLWFYSPAVFACMSVQRELAPGGPGPGLRPGRKRFLCQLPLWFYIYTSIRRTRAASDQAVISYLLVFNNRRINVVSAVI